MAAAVVNLYCEQGATLYREVTVAGNAYTGYTARGQVRDVCSGGKVVDLTCTVTSDTSTALVFTIALTAAQTALLTAPGNRYSNVTRYCYDVELVKAGATPVVLRLFNGDFIVSPESTK